MGCLNCCFVAIDFSSKIGIRSCGGCIVGWLRYEFRMNEGCFDRWSRPRRAHSRDSRLHAKKCFAEEGKVLSGLSARAAG